MKRKKEIAKEIAQLIRKLKKLMKAKSFIYIEKR